MKPIKLKEVVTLIVAFVICAALVSSLTGCATTQETSLRTEVALWTQDIATVALIAKPEYRLAMQAAVWALDSAEGTGAIDLNTISAALGKIPALQSRDSLLGIAGGRLVIRRAFGNVALETPGQINEAGLGIRDGLKAALGQ